MSSTSKQNVIVINSSHYLPTGSGNKFVYRFQPGFQFSANDKVGVQSLSIFNSFFNISETYGNNLFTFEFPCHNPDTSSAAVFQGHIGNSVQFTGQITNPSNIEITGGTISNQATFTGFIGGAKTAIAGGYISGNILRITSGTPALSVNQYINGSGTRILSGNNTSGWTLSDSALSPTGSVGSPSTTIFATAAGSTLYITSVPSSPVPLTGTALTNTIFVQASGFSSQTITSTNITQIAPTNVTLTSTTPVYLSSRQFSAGAGSTSFTGTSDGQVFDGMTFSLNGTTYTIQNPSLAGNTLSFTLSNPVGIFPGTNIQNVGIPNNAFSILTVSGTPVGDGIFLQGSTMTLSGTGVNSGVTVLDQLSSSGTETGGAGVYKTSYNPNTAVQTMTVNDSVTNNANLYVSSVTSGTIVPGQIFKIGSQYFNIDSVVSSGVYGISSTGTIPSIYPQTITTSLSFSNSIVVHVRIPDGYYTAEALNYYLQNIMIANNCYLTDSTGTGINTYYFEIMQNSTYYGFQINVYPLPKVLPSSLAYPSGASWTLLNDSNSYTPVLSIGAGLQRYFGFSSGIVSKTSGQISINSEGTMSIPATTTTLQTSQTNVYLSNKTYTFISDACPQVTWVNSLVMDCNLINSKYNSERSSIFYSIPLSASFGNLITIPPYQPCLCSITSGIYQTIELSFYDTQGIPIFCRDSDVTVTLVLATEENNHHQQRQV